MVLADYEVFFKEQEGNMAACIATHIHKRDKNYVAIKNNSSKECKCTVSYHYLDLVLALWSNGVYSSVE